MSEMTKSARAGATGDSEQERPKSWVLRRLLQNSQRRRRRDVLRGQNGPQESLGWSMALVGCPAAHDFPAMHQRYTCPSIPRWPAGRPSDRPNLRLGPNLVTVHLVKPVFKWRTTTRTVSVFSRILNWGREQGVNRVSGGGEGNYLVDNFY